MVDVEQAIAGCMADMTEVWNKAKLQAELDGKPFTDPPITRELVLRYLAPFIPGIK